MEWGTVSTANMMGMVFTLAVAIVLPIVLLIIVRRKTGAGISAFFIGCGIFIGFALILERILHVIVLRTVGNILQSNIFLYGLYGGLAAALFEETGRLIAMKFFMKKNLNKGNALMYGVGHGGAEAVIIVGLSSVSNLISSMMINNGGMQMTVSLLEPSLQEATYQQLKALWELPAYQFYLGGVERISAIVLQICFSVLVYKAVKAENKKFWAAAFLLHFIVDFVTVVTAGIGIPVWAVEIEIMVITAIIAYYTLRIYNKSVDNPADP